MEQAHKVRETQTREHVRNSITVMKVGACEVQWFGSSKLLEIWPRRYQWRIWNYDIFCNHVCFARNWAENSWWTSPCRGNGSCTLKRKPHEWCWICPLSSCEKVMIQMHVSGRGGNGLSHAYRCRKMACHDWKYFLKIIIDLFQLCIVTFSLPLWILELRHILDMSVNMSVKKKIVFS